ncbi:hypothetical protein JCM19275_2067 [Nonlabens ulvanivorans]|uniref:Uncharacterized protein n=1 Tax=Nonlabens ulvanivorans TaxID=906888 RepID=A0A090WIC5_NONUL|nr:hypothetical protein JCM19314_811 [Nonlabens ulvanivorans]GAL76731.1 hypothetical protein JCM19275_2067 [Nonlabens ulvanivorans]
MVMDIKEGFNYAFAEALYATPIFIKHHLIHFSSFMGGI